MDTRIFARLNQAYLSLRYNHPIFEPYHDDLWEVVAANNYTGSYTYTFASIKNSQIRIIAPQAAVTKFVVTTQWFLEHPEADQY